MSAHLRRRTARARAIGRLGPWLRCGGLGLLAAAVPLCSGAQAPGGDDAAVWIVDPKAPGADVPAAGRSLFDHLFVEDAPDGARHRLPFPFTALLRAVKHRLDPAGVPVRSVLIPLGRSLQRSAAAPEYFRFPRVVVAVTGMPRDASQPLLKDRLYLGYQEKAGVLEVISYNEAVARFEFQVVKDYRAGTKPRVFYARRAVCLACHQNGAPMFARPLWDETNANAAVAARLGAVAAHYQGLPARAGIEDPYAIDAATDRANLYAATQLLWRDGCGAGDAGVQCRAAALELSLRFLLGGAQGIDLADAAYTGSLAPALGRQSRRQWPAGLKVPNPDLPNRVSLASPEDEPGAPDHVAAPFEPLALRSPLESWQADEHLGIRLVSGLAEFIAAPDVRRLDDHLRGLDARRTRHEVPCTITERADGGAGRRIGFRCGSTGDAARWAGRLYGRDGRITHGEADRLAIGAGRDAVGLVVTGGTLRREGRVWHATFRVRRGVAGGRTPDGRAIESMALRWSPGGAGAGVVVLRDDFTAVSGAIARLAGGTLDGRLDAFAPRPFQRARVLAALFDELGMARARWCCLDDRGMPAAAVDDADGTAPEGAVANLPAAVQDFLRYCGACHRSPDAFPPNYLHGDVAEIEARLAQCAPRIRFRLAMGRLPASARAKTPMPPVHALPMFGRTEAQWRDGPELARLEAHAARLAGAESAVTGGYEALRPCLAAGPRSADP
jgi:hypothetical protein